MSDIDEDTIQTIVTEARAKFDLKARLQNRSTRTKTVRVFTDEVIGERLGGIERYTATGAAGLPEQRQRRWGIAGQIADLRDDLETDHTKEIEALVAEATELVGLMDQSALVIELQALPQLILRDAERAAKKARGIKGRIKEEEYADYLEEQSAQLLTRAVVTIEDVSTGEKTGKIDIEDARDLRNYLPASEYNKLYKALDELNFQNAIGDASTADADFLQAI